MTRVTVNGAELAVSERGTGEPVVLVHGSASDARTWDRQVAAFSASFRTITYSRRHHWPHAEVSDGVEYSMPPHVDDLQALLHVLRAAPAHLVGHSYGAFVCLLLAMRDPAAVRSLVLCEPPVVTLFVSPTPKPLELLRLLRTRPRTAAAIVRFGVFGVVPATKALRRGDAESAIRRFGDAVFGAGGYDRLSLDRKAQVRDNHPNIRAELLGPGVPPLDPTRVRHVRARTLLVNGTRSVGLFRHLTDRLEELLPGAGRVVIADAGHMMHEDQPEAFNAAVMGFLANDR